MGGMGGNAQALTRKVVWREQVEAGGGESKKGQRSKGLGEPDSFTLGN